ncbi:hypothetical protein SRABI128_04521 [Microbacterium sp. Bi128]|nr:hypothetical protein SRABI128_04521 [Microbacterium sp. Bi128]
MNPAPKTEVLVVGPVRDEEPGVSDVGGVAVARSKDQGEGGAGRDGGAGDVDVVEGGTERDEMHGRLVAEQLLDHRDGQAGVSAQPLELGRVAEQRQYAVGDEVHGGFMSGDEQEKPGAHQLFVRHAALRAIIGGHR